MSSDISEKNKYIEAQKRVNRLKVFYIHLAGYIVLVGLLVWNLIIIEDGEYKNAIVWLNCTTIVVWGIVLALHAWTTFKGKILFGKKWEERKVKELMKEDNMQ